MKILNGATALLLPLALTGGAALSPGPSSAEHAQLTADIRAVSVTAVVRGAALPGANGLAFDRRGGLVVANGSGSRITTIDPQSGRVLRTLTAAGSEVTYPDDVAVGPDGSLYWTELFTGEVVRRAASGQVMVVARIGEGLNPVAVSPEGRVFVATCFPGDSILEIDPRGVRAPRPVLESVGAGCAANGMDIGADGRLYAPQPALGRIVAVDVDTGALEVIAEDLGPALFGVDVAPDGAVFAVDTGALKRVDAATREVTTVARLGFLADNVAVDDTGRPFVSSLTDAAVVEVRPDGSQRVVSRGGVVTPQGLD
ncbi:MAG: hypothetical protein ACRCY8_00560, partial [Dermatophilaceae bacterium]